VPNRVFGLTPYWLNPCQYLAEFRQAGGRGKSLGYARLASRAAGEAGREAMSNIQQTISNNIQSRRARGTRFGNIGPSTFMIGRSTFDICSGGELQRCPGSRPPEQCPGCTVRQVLDDHAGPGDDRPALAGVVQGDGNFCILHH
jgi:hypothetical protein